MDISSEDCDGLKEQRFVPSEGEASAGESTQVSILTGGRGAGLQPHLCVFIRKTYVHVYSADIQELLAL